MSSALVIGAECISPIMDWSNRDVAVLFGDGAAALYLESSDEETGVLAESLGCYGEARDILSVQGWGMKYANQQKYFGESNWAFIGQEIFKKAVSGMAQACDKVLEKSGFLPENISLVVPHQANLRIIDTLVKKLKMDKDNVFVNIEKYGNMSAATILVALVEAVEEGKVNAGDILLMPAFGGGLTWSAHLVKWGNNVSAIGKSDVELPQCPYSGLTLVQNILKNKE